MPHACLRNFQEKDDLRTKPDDIPILHLSSLLITVPGTSHHSPSRAWLHSSEISQLQQVIVNKMQKDGIYPSQIGQQTEQETWSDPAQNDEGEAQDRDFPGFQHPDLERFDLGEDVYSLIFIAPVCSACFWFSFYCISLKLTLFTFLAIDLYRQSSGQFQEKDILIRATQFFLLPVAVALQEDLIHVYTRVANIRYDPEIQKRSPAATEWKFALSFLLRFIDGLYSLIINFVLLLITDKVLSLFLNFAALGFLQSIDDIAFHLAVNGYLGDRIEDNCLIVKTATLPRRVGDCFTNSLDSILFLATYGVMLAIYIYIVVNETYGPLR